MMHSPAGTVRQLAGTTDQVEVFCLPDHYPEFEGETGERPPHGWYWWCVVDGGHPDSYMVGPFASELEAWGDASVSSSAEPAGGVEF